MSQRNVGRIIVKPLRTRRVDDGGARSARPTLRIWPACLLLACLIGCSGKAPPPPVLTEDLAQVVEEPEAVSTEPAPQIPTELQPPAVNVDQDLDRLLAALPRTIAANAVRLTDPALGREMRAGGTAAATATSEATPSRGWEIQFFKGNTLETYARQLDFFGFEIGVLEPNGKIVYVFNLSKQKPDTRTGPAQTEKRYYLTWSRGDLTAADRGLLGQASVKADDKLILLFLPPEVETSLAALAKSHAGAKADSVEKTRFALRRKGEGYELYVMEQTYRQQPGVRR